MTRLSIQPRRAGVALAAAAALTGSLALMSPVTASAGDPAEGTCKTFDDPQYNGWTTHAELGRRLDEIERTSKGRVQVDVVGRTQLGRELYTARVGTGDRVLLVQSAIHGNERTGTEALLGILKDIGTGNDPDTQRALQGVTLIAMPMVNPDGGEINRRATG